MIRTQIHCQMEWNKTAQMSFSPEHSVKSRNHPKKHSVNYTFDAMNTIQ